MNGARVRVLEGLLATALLLAIAPVAAAAPPAGEYRDDDFGGGINYNIVPPGQSGFTSPAAAADFLTNGQRPPHQADQNDMYANLVYDSPGLKSSQILDYFKDQSFGVRPGDVERTYTPECLVVTAPSPASDRCGEVTIVRDAGFGVPHVYGANRAALMFGLGYVTAEDRLVLADVLRHAGRGELSEFAGGSNAAMDADTYESAPYASDAEYRAQFDNGELFAERAGVPVAEARQVQDDVINYVDGINQFIAESRIDPSKVDALYAALGQPQGAEPWKVEDVIATGALVAGIFGKGGGGELDAATALQEARAKFGRKQGKRVWKDFLSADDPEAPRTVRKGSFPYRELPKGKARGRAMPDPGSLEREQVVVGAEGSAAQQSSPGETIDGMLEPLRELDAASNALLVSGRESEGGNPVVVFGPQTGYFAPQLLMEQDAHAPSTPEFGPAIHARGVAFVGTNLYVQLGRGVDYSWSATSASQDIVDVYALDLCEPDGSAPTIDSGHYLFEGQCLPLEVLTKTISWTPNAADPTPPGSQTMRVLRTKAGIVSHRATIDGKPVVYTRLRATYKHEVDSAVAFAAWNSPEQTTDVESFQDNAYKNDLTFNWFYADDEQIGYFNSGANPIRPKGTHPNFPVRGDLDFMWRNFDPELNTFTRQPQAGHAQVIDQRYLSSWNNKWAKGMRCDGLKCYTPVYRVDSLDERIEDGIRGKRKMSLVELIDAMEDAGTVDVRGSQVVPRALKVLKRTGNARSDAYRTMKAWVRSGAHRRDFDNDGDYDDAEAVKIMDAWWPLWVKRQFQPTLGRELQETLIGGSIHDAPGPVGSAFNDNTYGFIDKDLRTIAGAKVKAPYSRIYCGQGKLKRCGKLLASTLDAAAATEPEELYGGEGCTLNNGTAATPQMCNDAVNATDVTIAPVDEFHWINRPTFQQVVSYPDGRDGG